MTLPPPLLPLIQQMPYFAKLTPAALIQVADSAVSHSASAGEFLFSEGEPSKGLWIIQQGRIKIYKLNPQGQEYILRILGDGDTFNDISAFDGGTNPANAAALSDSTLWILPSQTFQQLFLQDSAFAFHVIRLLSGRVRGLVRQIEELTLYSVLVRVARLLLKQAEDPALSGVGVTRAALATHLATTPQTISTALRDLERLGAIRFDRRQVWIVEEDILRSIALL